MSNQYLFELRESLDDLAKQLLQLSDTVKECSSQLPRQKKRRRVPPNSYTVYVREHLPQLKEREPELSQTSALQRLALSWNKLSEEEKVQYQTRATEKSRTFFEQVGDKKPDVRKPRCLHCFEAHRVCFGGTPCIRCTGLGIECKDRTRKPRVSTKV